MNCNPKVGYFLTVSDMGAVTIRNVPEEVHRAIQVRAAQNGRTFQAEICEILATVVKPEGRVKLGDLLADIGRKVKLTDEEMVAFDRPQSPHRNTLRAATGPRRSPDSAANRPRSSTTHPFQV
ncbi:MAG: hypothetical protein WCX93_03195 [Burkholderiaceae bacterium]